MHSAANDDAAGRFRGVRNLLRKLGGSTRGLLLPNVCPDCRRRLAAEPGEPCAECLAEWKLLPEPRCPGCGGGLDNSLKLCGECLQHGLAGGWPWTVAVAAAPFSGAVRDGVHRFKYQGATELARPFARRMREAWERFGDGVPDAVVPVPLHWWRELRRGYNQSEILARAVAAPWGVPVRHLLRRKRWTRQQARLHFQDRQKNMKNVFAVRGGPVSGHLLLVDDVFTTGATLAAAAGILVEAGAERISVLTIARG